MLSEESKFTQKNQLSQEVSHPGLLSPYIQDTFLFMLCAVVGFAVTGFFFRTRHVAGLLKNYTKTYTINRKRRSSTI